MSEKNNENNEQYPALHLDKDRLRDLTNNLINSENSIDLGSLVSVASNLLKNQSVLNTVSALAKTEENDIQDSPNSIEVKKQTDRDTSSEMVNDFSNRALGISNDLTALRDIITNEFSDIKNQLKKQNSYLKELTREIYKYRKSKK